MNQKLISVEHLIAAEYMSERLAGIPEVSDKFQAGGRFFVFVPEGSTQEQLNNLKSGGIVGVAGQGASVVRALAKHMAREWPRRGSPGLISSIPSQLAHHH